MSHSVDECYISYVKTVHKARKRHVCDACERPISCGDHYTRVYILFEGEKETVKRCGRCETMHVHLVKKCGEDSYGDQWPNEELDCGHEYEEQWGEEPPPEIAALAFLTDEEAGKLLEKKP